MHTQENISRRHKLLCMDVRQKHVAAVAEGKGMSNSWCCVYSILASKNWNNLFKMQITNILFIDSVLIV